MFKSITYLQSDYKKDCNIYKLIDTDFECETYLAYRVSPKTAMGVAVILEYKKRQYCHEEIVKNLFRCNVHMTYKYHHCSFEDILNWQNKYIDMCFKDIDFSKLYYQELKDMWDKYKVFI